MWLRCVCGLESHKLMCCRLLFGIAQVGQATRATSPSASHEQMITSLPFVKMACTPKIEVCFAIRSQHSKAVETTSRIQIKEVSPPRLGSRIRKSTSIAIACMIGVCLYRPKAARRTLPRTRHRYRQIKCAPLATAAPTPLTRDTVLRTGSGADRFRCPEQFEVLNSADL